MDIKVILNNILPFCLFVAEFFVLFFILGKISEFMYKNSDKLPSWVCVSWIISNIIFRICIFIWVTWTLCKHPVWVISIVVLYICFLVTIMILANKDVKRYKQISLKNEKHIISNEFSTLNFSYEVDKAFKHTKEEIDIDPELVAAVSVYAPNKEYKMTDIPQICIQPDNWGIIDDFKQKGTSTKVQDLVPLNGKFIFKAKKPEGKNDVMYFYAFEDEIDDCFKKDCEEEYYIRNLLFCLIYPKELVGTEEETKLMKVLDEAAETLKKVPYKG